MKLCASHALLATAVILAGCSFGPQLQTRLPQVRDVPVLANLTPQQAFANGRTYLASKQYGLAIELFKSAKRDPALAVDSLNGLAIAYDGIGRGDLAERYFQEALAVRSDDARTRRNLANFYATSGQKKKRAALLADKMPAVTAIASGDSANFSKDSGSAAAVSVPPKTAHAPAAATLQSLSPLGSVFRPLLASFTPNALESEAPLAEYRPGTIDCLTGDAVAADATGSGPMTIYRLSIGEVFITARPRDAICDVDAENGSRGERDTISNTEYLGMVAAYLDRLNRSQMLAELAVFQHGST